MKNSNSKAKGDRRIRLLKQSAYHPEEMLHIIIQQVYFVLIDIWLIFVLIDMSICMNILRYSPINLLIMKQKSTLRKLLTKQNLLIAAMLSLFVVFGCYDFRTVDQPTEASTNSSFTVDIVLGDDGDPSNDWTLEDGSLEKTGLFGILLPEGWTIDDNIALTIEAADSLPDGEGGYNYPGEDHDGTYVITYSESQTTMLNDSTSTPPTGYYWWGATSATPVDMAFFDSLYFTVTVNTDDQEGEFYLQYAVGDVDYWGRMPYDPNVITEPLPINITSTAVNAFFSETSLSVYPNPSYGNLNIDLKAFSGDPVELMIHDMRGKEVLNRQITHANSSFDISDLVPGSYVVRLTAGEAVTTRKLLKY